VAVKEVACVKEGKGKESLHDRAASASGLRAVERSRPQAPRGTRFRAQRVIIPYSGCEDATENREGYSLLNA
jgi:hypothetical protein